MKIKTIKDIFFKRKYVYTFIMRVFIFFLALTLFSFSPSGVLSQNVKVFIKSDQKATMDEIFELIKKQTNYRFVYRSDMFKDLPKVHLNKGTINVNSLLERSLSTEKFKYEVVNSNTIIIKEIPAQSREEIEIKGKITDYNGQPVPGITVYVTSTKPQGGMPAKNFVLRGTSTDFDGSFTLKAEVGYYIVVTGIGFQLYTEEVVNNKTVYDIKVKEQISALDEVMVVGFGTTKKRDLTGSVSSMNSEQIVQTKTQTIDQALTGRMAGVFVQNKGGQPGAGAFVQVRGVTQIRGDNQPLYVIDGVPVVITPNSESLGLINYGTRENPLLSINPDDIEKIDVLKDASAAAIYGSRAANGVIMVTTKKGKLGQKPTFNFSVNSTFQNPVDKYDYLSSSEYIDFAKKNAQIMLNAYPAAYWPIYYPDQYAMVTNPDGYFGKANTDWQDLITNKNALWTDYKLGVRGGTGNVTYYTSLGVSNQDGIIVDTNFKRYNFSTNLDANVTDYLKVGTVLNYNYSKNSNGGFNSLSQGNFRPDLAPYNEDGTYSTFNGIYGKQYTMLGNGKQLHKTAISKNLLGTVFGELKIIDGLKFRSQINVGLIDNDVETFSSSKSLTALANARNYSRPGATLGVQTNHSWTTSFSNTLTYIKKLQNHSIDAVVGVSWDKSRFDAESQSYRGFPDDTNLININSASFFDSASSESIQQGLNSIFGRVNYGYKNRYLATFTARRDGSTKFGPDNQYGFFPSGALAWNVHNENFMKNISAISQLKLRGSYGVVGSDNLPSFTYLAYYQAMENNGSFYDGKNGIVVTGVPNTGIRWEETKQLDLGFELGMFNNRLNAEVVYYKKNTSGIILFSPIPAETGSMSWNTNVADLSNRGWEFTIGGDIIRGKDFRWNSSVNISTLKNNVDHLYGANAGSQNGVLEGSPLGVIYGYDVVKIAQTQEEINDLNSKAGGVYQSSLTKPGDYIFKDINGDGIIDTDDRGPIGNPNPDFYGGWNNQLSYKNWEFNMNWNFVHGAERSYQDITNMYAIKTDVNVTHLVNDTWAEDNREASFARYGSPTAGYVETSRSVVDASYIKLRSASIAYNLPKEIYKSLQISNVRLAVSGNNLLTITKYPGLDPEDTVPTGFANRTTSFNTDSGASYPNVRSFSFSLNVTF